MSDATYAMDIPALAELASGIPDHPPAPAIAKGEPLKDAHVAAACRQHQNRKRLAMTDPPLVTDEELVASKRRKHLVVSCNFDKSTKTIMPQELVTMMKTMEQDLKQIKQNMEQMYRRMVEESQRSMNRSRRRNSDPIQPLIRLVDGLKPTDGGPFQVWFPVDYEDLWDGNENRINNLVAFYSLPDNGTLTEKKQLLEAHFGMIL